MAWCWRQHRVQLRRLMVSWWLVLSPGDFLLLAQSPLPCCQVVPLNQYLSCHEVWLSLCPLQLLLQCLVYSERHLHLWLLPLWLLAWLPDKRYTPESCELW